MPMASRYSPTDLREIEINKVLKSPRTFNSKNTWAHCDLGGEKEMATKGTQQHRDLYHSCFPQLVRNRQTLETAESEKCPLATPDIKDKEGKEDINLIKSRLMREEIQVGLSGERPLDTRLKENISTPASLEPMKLHKIKPKHQKLQEIMNLCQDDASLLQNLRRALDVPVTSLQWIRRPSQQFCPNMWQTIVRDRIENEPRVEKDRTDSTDDEQAYEASLDTKSSNEGKSSENQTAKNKHGSGEDKVKLKKRKKNKQNASKDSGSGATGLLVHSHEIIYPPYHVNSKGSNHICSGTQISSDQGRSAFPASNLCSFVHSIMAETDNGGPNNPFDSHDDPEMEFACNSRGKSVPLKWSQPGDNIPGDVRRECHIMGYEILRKIWRGKIREHRYLYMADNKRNFQYSPVEVTVIRQPYAKFTSSTVFARDTKTTTQDYAKSNAIDLPPHRNLIMLLHRFYGTEWVYTVTEHCQWPSLEHLIKSTDAITTRDSGEKRGLSEKSCRTVFRQVCAGMAHLHQHGVLHGDLNCHNILVTDKLEVKLTGYGPTCQRMINSQLKKKGRLKLFGDPYDIYTPPEIMSRGDIWTYACDVWCIGIALLHMTLGEIPNEINTAVRLSGTMRNLERISLACVGYQLSLLIDKILQPRPALRPDVWMIAEHNWMSDGTDLATSIRQRAVKGDPMRTDGHTFPLPKRLQRQMNRTPEAFYNENADEEEEQEGDWSEEEIEAEDSNGKKKNGDLSREMRVEHQGSADSEDAASPKQIKCPVVKAKGISTPNTLFTNAIIMQNGGNSREDFVIQRDQDKRFEYNQAVGTTVNDAEHEELLALCDRLEFQESCSEKGKDTRSLWEIINDYESAKSPRRLAEPLSCSIQNRTCVNRDQVDKSVQSGNENVKGTNVRYLELTQSTYAQSSSCQFSNPREARYSEFGVDSVGPLDDNVQNEFVIDNDELALLEIESLIRRQEQKLSLRGNKGM